jgi:hypothetical protein
MKKLFLILGLMFTLSLAAVAGDLRSASLLTGSYVTSDAVEFTYDDKVTVEVIVSGTPEALTGYLVAEMSVDGTNFFPVIINVPGTATATEQPYTRLTKRWSFSTNAAGVAWAETFERWGAAHWLRVKLMESTASGTTTALVKVKATTSKR